MKRIISTLLVVAMLASMAVFTAHAEGGPSNVSVNAAYMSKQPTFDGVINADEWGAPTFEVKGSEAVQPGAQTPGEHNTFAHYEYYLDADGNPVATDIHGKVDEETGLKPKTDKYKDVILNTNYKVWLRWDLKYCYIAVEVEDPDGYYLADGRANIWDGDCVQFRLDPSGPNSYQSYKDPTYDYTTTPFDYTKANSVGRMPWVYPTKICNIGLGQVVKKNGSLDKQAYDMAETGNMEATQQLNDAKLAATIKGEPNEKTGGVDMQSLFDMKVTENANGSSTNVYEYAVPWAYVNQWNLGQVAVDYAWGMSLVVLQGNAESKKYNSYLTWGSGICGAQQDVTELNPTIGGSNAVVLSNIDALTGEVVEGLPVKTERSNDDKTENILDSRGIDAAYLGTTYEYTVPSEGFTTAIDFAYIAGHPTDEQITKFGFALGTDYKMFAGWTGAEKKFVVATNTWNNGIDRNIPFAESEKTFDFDAENVVTTEDGTEEIVGQWHRLAVNVVDTTIKVYLDGELVLEDTDARNKTGQTTGEKSQVILYNQGDIVFDNWVLASKDYNDATGKGGEVFFDFTFNGDDAVYNSSDVKLQAIQMGHEAIKGVCHDCAAVADYEDDGYGHNFKNGKCLYCGAEGGVSVTYGDVNGDTKVNLSDVTLMLKQIAGWDVSCDAAAADANGDGKVNLTDVTLVLKFIAGWDVVLGPQAK